MKLSAQQKLDAHLAAEQAVKNPQVPLYAIQTGASRTGTTLFWRFFCVIEGRLKCVTKQVAQLTGNAQPPYYTAVYGISISNKFPPRILAEHPNLGKRPERVVVL